MIEFLNWLLWCIKLKEILSKEVGLVSHRKLTKEEWEFPENFIIDFEKKKVHKRGTLCQK